eukprot:TRINITY_DN12474_c0_g1_i1.p1 TRINITY_DN12474_c0_g1~~TRINITY_DN12474_c0_g1_i1.p1  ORF type:complete len:118 (-),score=44.96 TRINITY_DN12474_c0_g1_i1:288-641(-)
MNKSEGEEGQKELERKRAEEEEVEEEKETDVLIRKVLGFTKEELKEWRKEAAYWEKEEAEGRVVSRPKKGTKGYIEYLSTVGEEFGEEESDIVFCSLYDDKDMSCVDLEDLERCKKV